MGGETRAGASFSCFLLLLVSRELTINGVQGYHNVAETKYGTPEWDRYWSKLNGDDEMTVRCFLPFLVRSFPR
jgi:hypothetical protein